MIQRLMDLKINHVLWVMVLFSVLMVVSAFVIEHVFGAAPCPMCWQQRYAHWAIGGFALLALIIPFGKFKHYSVWLIIFSALAGLYVAMHQTLGQLGFVELTSCMGGQGVSENAEDMFAALSAPQNIPDCADKGFTIFGLTLAMWNVFIMSAVASMLTRWLIVNKNEN